MSLWARIADLPLEIERHALEPLELATNAGWTRRTTLVRLEGGGHAGTGEDVTYDADEQRAFAERGGDLPLAGRTTLDGFSHRLDALDPHPVPSSTPAERLYRRWAFESAALDLALRQSGLSLAAALGREARPVRYVVSTGLGTPPSVDALRRRLDAYPDLRFKVDLAASWTEPLVRELAALGRVDTVDLKGQYHGVFQGPPPSAEQYRWIAEYLPDAWIEDPWLDDATRPVLEPHRARLTWDAILHALADVIALPWRPRCINVKPSRFGLFSELLRVYEWCEARGVAMYGGGQFELGVGRAQIQALASLFHADGANDVAPSGFNAVEPAPGLPPSPLPPASDTPGFGS